MEKIIWPWPGSKDLEFYILVKLVTTSLSNFDTLWLQLCDSLVNMKNETPQLKKQTKPQMKKKSI